ncbi:MAG: SdpI family protein, partial [Candidatus Aenigmatarchaeota archaeon]
MCSTKFTLAAAAVMVALSFALSVYFYPVLPESMASHWGIRGNVDGYMQKPLAAFLMPAMLAAMALLFFAIPRIDPLKANIDKFRGHYYGFIVVFCAFILLLHLQVLLWNVGIRINPASTMPLAMGVLFYYMGVMVENAKRNWFIGIRTPWTLSSDSVWDKTHRLGGRLFKVAGIIALFGVLFPAFAFYFVIVPVLSVVFYTIIYSYLEFKKEERIGKIPVVSLDIKAVAAPRVSKSSSVRSIRGKKAKKAGRAGKKKTAVRKGK